MKIFTVILLGIGLMVGSFGYWGVYTVAGRHKYDEMAGIIPSLALLISAILLFIALLLTLVLLVRHHNSIKKIKG